MTATFHVDIVSVEGAIFSGPCEKLFVTGVMGELEVLYNHAALLTMLQPGPIWLIKENGEEEALYISGGMLEVQSSCTTVLADTAIRAKDVDAVAASEAKKRAEEALSGHSGDFDYAQAHTQLMEAVAQLRSLKKIRDHLR